MRVISALIFLGLFFAAFVPGFGPTVVSGQADPTATPAATVGTPAPTSTTTGGPTATSTLIPTVTGTTTPGVAAVVQSVSPNAVGSVNSNQITVTGTGFMPGAAITLDGRVIESRWVSPTQVTGIVPAGFAPGPYGIAVVNPGLPPSAPLGGLFNIQTAGPTLYVPVAIKRSSDDSTAMFIQNISPGPTTVNVQFYDFNGFSDPRWSQQAPIAPGSSAIFDLATIPSLPSGFNGSAVVQSPAAITGVVNRVMYTGSTELGSDEVRAAQGARSSTGSFPLMSGEGAPNVTVPVAFGGYHGYFTTVSIQNTSRTAGNYTVTLFPTGITTPIVTIPRIIPPLAAARVRLTPENGVPPDFVGTVVIAGAGVTMVVASETIQFDTGMLLSYSAVPGGSNVMNAPLMFKNYNGWVSGAQIVNVSSAPITVNAQIFQRDNPISFNLPPRPLAPNESYTYYLPAVPNLPDGFVGSAVFTASGPIAAVVQELNAERGTGMAYSGFGRGSPNISVPVIFKGSAGWDSGVQVQNLGPTDATVNITYHWSSQGFGPGTAVDAALIPGGSSNTFYQPDSPGIPPNTIGSAIVSSVSGQPIVAIVNEVNYTRQGDASMAYEGINY